MKRKHATARRRPPLGQHFLADPGIRRRILDWLDPRPDDCWLEIGAGHGEMTLSLAQASGRVTAVERDPRLAQALRERLANVPAAEVVEGDILELPLAQVALAPSSARLRVYGSLPYYITSPILHRLFDAGDALADVHVIIQREVAKRLVATPHHRDYGYLSVLTQFHSTPEILHAIPRGAFRPLPRVDSAFVRLLPPGERARLGLDDKEDFLRFVQSCFRQKRKTLANNLRRFYAPLPLEKALVEAELGPSARAEELSLDEFVRLYRILGRARIGHAARAVVPSKAV